MSRVFRCGDFEFVQDSGELKTGNGETKGLHRQPALVLALLLDHPGEIVTKSAIRRALWQDGAEPADVDGAIAGIVRNIRVALGDDGESRRFIETKPKRGYRFLTTSGAWDESVEEGDEKPQTTRVTAVLLLIPAVIALGTLDLQLLAVGAIFNIALSVPFLLVAFQLMSTFSKERRLRWFQATMVGIWLIWPATYVLYALYWYDQRDTHYILAKPITQRLLNGVGILELFLLCGSLLFFATKSRATTNAGVGFVVCGLAAASAVTLGYGGAAPDSVLALYQFLLAAVLVGYGGALLYRGAPRAAAITFLIYGIAQLSFLLFWRGFLYRFAFALGVFAMLRLMMGVAWIEVYLWLRGRRVRDSGTDPGVADVIRWVVQRPVATLVLFVLSISAVGAVYQWHLLAEFGIHNHSVLASDLLIAGLRSIYPLLITAIATPVALRFVVSTRRLSPSPAFRAATTALFLTVCILAPPYWFAEVNAARIRSSENGDVRVKHRVVERRTEVIVASKIVATTQSLFLYDPRDDRPVEIPVSNVVSVESVGSARR